MRGGGCLPSWELPLSTEAHELRLLAAPLVIAGASAQPQTIVDASQSKTAGACFVSFV